MQVSLSQSIFRVIDFRIWTESGADPGRNLGGGTYTSCSDGMEYAPAFGGSSHENLHASAPQNLLLTSAEAGTQNASCSPLPPLPNHV